MRTNYQAFGGSARNQKRASRAGSKGFSLIELVIVVAVVSILAAMAVPYIGTSLKYYNLRASVSSVTAAIQSNRYQAIFHGCRYQVAFTASTNSYAVSTTSDPAGSGTCLATFGTASASVPLAGKGASLSANSTLVFYPNGQVTATTGTSNPITLVINYSPLPSETITVSNFGRINVAP